MVHEENLGTNGSDDATTTTNVEVETNNTDLQVELDAERVKTKDLWDKIYKLKKENKNVQPWESTLWREDMESFYNEKRFYENNPELLEHKEQLTELTARGNSLDDAKFLLERKDPTIANRQVAKQSNFTSWEVAFDVSFTDDDLSKMDQRDYNKARDLIDLGKAKWVR